MQNEETASFAASESHSEATSDHPRFSTNLNDDSVLDKTSRSSVTPGNVMITDSPITQQIFKYINDNEFKKLGTYLSQKGDSVDVVEIEESRQYSALAFCAFKNHTTCFKIIYNHGRIINKCGDL